ncbi:ATP-dependent zinc metalloprotease FtsH [Clostridium tepidum]|uniref:ATP-dependent zinc metalloprotease FtsH n=1 Tax=Clostridium tepidum TaxID=1962263 RepID=A0A1S9I1T8_9CLOT|nr:ATP-dependent zinc metalloprotease FtsH [Clostridium tepidum]MDU6877246.1 ATP-dependent zinc metalloprotease FtsH [Clostridium botulinum]OOO64238.1 cell division protein FtsH [Clostridium tepidum]
MNKIKNKIIILPILTAFLSIAVMLSFNFYSSKNATKNYNEFLKDLNEKKVSTVYITNTSTIKVKLNSNEIYKTDNPRSNDFKENLLKKGVKISENSPMTPQEVIPLSIFALSILSIIFMTIKNSNILKNKKLSSVDSLDTDEVENINLNFDSIAGNEEAKESVKDIVDFLKNPEKYSSYGARMPKGIILYGEPGTGKTLMAKAVAGEAGVPFYAMSGSDFVQVYVGVGASRIRQLFKKARSKGKAVIFIDEIDAIGKKRSSEKSGGSEERDQTLNALLTEMSGFNEKEGIIVMAATNRLDILDEALLRPGRFDRHIEINLPDVVAREKIFNLHLKNKPIGNVNIKDWAKKTAYFSGAKIENLLNEAAILACKENSVKIEDYHVDKAFSIVLAGYEKQNRAYIKNKDKKITAYHEIGHALISSIVLPNEKISKVTIIPSTKGAGGYTLSIPEDSLYQSKEYLINRIMVLLGGRVAEEIIFGKDNITTGAHNDLQKSTSIAYKMVTEYGMGETLGLLNMGSLKHELSINENDIIKECKSLVDNIYIKVKDILLKEKKQLDILSEKLLEKETLYEEDFIGL